MSHLPTGTTPAELFLKPQLRTRLRCIKPNLREYVEGKQQKMKDQHDGRNSQMREFQKEDQVQVKTTVPGQKWKWVSGVIHRRLGPLTYLVRVGKRIRYCHADHLLTSSAILLERDPTLQPLDLSSLSMKNLYRMTYRCFQRLPDNLRRNLENQVWRTPRTSWRNRMRNEEMRHQSW